MQKYATIHRHIETQLPYFSIISPQHCFVSQGSLASQLTTVEQALTKADAERRAIDDVKALASEIDQRKIHFNPYTTVTVADMETQLQDFTDILVYKKPLLEKEIEFKRSRGVSQAQIDVRGQAQERETIA